jgi:hypothetical protein
MKFVVIAIFVFAISLALPIFIIYLFERKRNKKYKMGIKILISIISSIILMITVTCSYLGIFYRATDDALEYLNNDSNIDIYDESDYYFLDNKENDKNVIIFYPGGKVEESAYLPLMHNIAENNIDIYIIKMPFHFALFGINKANMVLENTSYENVYLMGHSLGGTAISSYLSNTSNTIKGIIFLASYPTKKIDDNISSLSIYGTNDLVLNKKEYQNNKSLLPKNNTEIVIEGGNHCYFGNYGDQNNDGISTISRIEQQRITKDSIIKFIGT